MTLPRSDASPTKKLYVKTWGCQMNVYDSARMTDVLAPLGYRPVASVDDADMVILNTCHIREKATEKVFSELGRIRRAKDAKAAGGGTMIVAVAGCVAQAEGEEILNRAPTVDLVFGPQTYHQLPEMVARASETAGTRICNTDFPVEEKFDFLPEESADPGPSAYLSIQEGCDKFCTFCVVPYTRGAEFSRTVSGILDEARRLVGLGARELTLLGQNVNAFHGEGPNGTDWGLGRLIMAMAEIDGLDRIRYTTSHPKDMDDELIAAHRSVPALMPFLHLPVQSGSDRILAAMNRKHSQADYRAVVERLREARPDMALSSDFIVGFPGETDRDFAETLRLVTDVGYAQAYSFKYSARPGTPAAALDDQVPDAAKSERLGMLQELLNAQQQAFNQATVGQVVPVLLDRHGKRPGQLQGRSPAMQSVFVAANTAHYGSIVDVHIDAAFANSLTGTPVANRAVPTGQQPTLEAFA